VTPEEVEARVQAVAERAGKPVAEIRGFLQSPERRRGFESDILDEKTMAFLRARAKVRSG
jgi:hypothetical protein